MFSGSYVQLGWLQRAVNWCYDHILSPAFEFISNLINSILSVFFENALLPILELNMKFTTELVKTVFENFLYNILYRIGKLLLWCLDAVEQVFRLFAGLEPVYTQDINGQYVESGSFILAMLKSNYIITALLGMIAASFVLCFLVAILATVKAMGDMQDDGRKSKSVSKVLRHTANSLLRLLLIPIMSLFLVMLGDAILKSVDLATNNDQARVSDIIFTMSTLDAVRTDDNESPVDLAVEYLGIQDEQTLDHSDAEFYNSTTRAAALYDATDAEKKATSDFGLSDKYRNPFYKRETVSTGSLKRDVLAVVLQTFDLRRMDFIILIGGALMFILIFGIMAISMISRAFDLLILLLVEPFFAAYMPLDEGERFERWQETFLGRLVSCYGMVVAVNVYLSVINLIFSNQIAFFGEGTTPGVIYVVNLMFAMVGGYAILKSGPIITSIMSSSAASRETQSVTMGTTLTTSAMHMISTPFRKLGNFLVGQAKDSFSEAFANAIAGESANGDSGIGDAFGKVNKTSANGENIFNTAKKGSQSDIGSIIAPKSDMKDLLKPEDLAETVKDKDKIQDKVKDKITIELTDKLKEVDLKGKHPLVEGAGLLEPGLEPENGLLPPEYGFLEAGKSSNPIKNPTGYTYVGQEDAKERSEKKEMDELLGAEINEEALFAAESGTGLDLNGDGIVSGSEGDFTYTGSGNGSAHEAPKDTTGNQQMAELLGAEINEGALFAAESGTGIDLNGDGKISGSEGDFTFTGLNNGHAHEAPKETAGNQRMDELLGAEIDEVKLFGSDEGIANEAQKFEDLLGLDKSFEESFEKSYDDSFKEGFEDILKDKDDDNI